MLLDRPKEVLLSPPRSLVPCTILLRGRPGKFLLLVRGWAKAAGDGLFALGCLSLAATCFLVPLLPRSPPCRVLESRSTGPRPPWRSSFPHLWSVYGAGDEICDWKLHSTFLAILCLICGLSMAMTLGMKSVAGNSVPSSLQFRAPRRVDFPVPPTNNLPPRPPWQSLFRLWSGYGRW